MFGSMFGQAEVHEMLAEAAQEENPEIEIDSTSEHNTSADSAISATSYLSSTNSITEVRL